jgi:hypothetical protein
MLGAVGALQLDRGRGSRGVGYLGSSWSPWLRRGGGRSSWLMYRASGGMIEVNVDSEIHRRGLEDVGWLFEVFTAGPISLFHYSAGRSADLTPS